MHKLKPKFGLVFLLFSLIFPQAFSVHASGIAPKEDFIITPEEGKYSYPRNFSLRKGEEYIITGETKDSYIIEYEVFKGISLPVHVPKSKVEYIEETKIEQRERKQREAIRQFENEQKAKGLRKVDGYWVTKENAELWSQFLDLKRLRNEVIKLKEGNEKDDAELTAYLGDIARLKDQLISLQKKAEPLLK